MLDNRNSLSDSYEREDFEKEMAEIRREKALSYALEFSRGQGFAPLSDLIAKAKVIEKYLRDGEF